MTVGGEPGVMDEGFPLGKAVESGGGGVRRWNGDSTAIPTSGMKWMMDDAR
jgi:hypothetical protein